MSKKLKMNHGDAQIIMIYFRTKNKSSDLHPPLHTAEEEQKQRWVHQG